MGRNEYKKESKASKPNTKKTKVKRANPFNKLSKLFVKITSDKKFSQITGITLLSLSAFLLLAFSSFLFTWKVDQNIINHHWNDPSIQVENWLGKLGAYASHQFIFNGFGVSSFLFVFLSFILGFRILFKSNLLPLGKSFKYAIFSIVWLSISLNYLFASSPILGGAFGFQTNLWLSSTIGGVGILLFLVLTALIFSVLNFNISFNIFSAKKDVASANYSEDETSGTTTSLNQEDDFEYETTEPIELKSETTVDTEVIKEPIDFITEEIKEEPLATETSEHELESEPEDTIPLSLDTNIPVEKSKTEEEEIEFSIEEPEIKEEVLSDKEVDSKIKDFGEYDPKLDLASYKLPSIDLLKDFGNTSKKVTPEELEANKNKIVETLSNYKIKIASIKATIGPTVTLYEIVPEAGVRISKIKNLEDDIALSLAALGIRIIAPIPGKGTVGIEVPNRNPEIVSMRAVVASDKFQEAKMELPVVMGKTITNETYVFDLAKMPHLLMAGATGQGKSVGLNAVLVSLLYKKHPSQLKFVLVDPKKVELTLYNKIERHYLAKLPDTEDAIITDNDKVINTLNSLCIEMDQRYELLKTAMVRNIVEYNAKFIARKLNPENGHKFLPYIVLVIDEFADLIMTAGKEVETPIARLAQLARAIGIHLIIATQRPSANIITGIIKANFPGRLAFRVTSGIDSRTILDASGADQLIGRGDMLISQGNDLIRLQCAFVDTPEVEEICDFIGEQRGYPETFTLPEYVGESATGGTGEFDGSDRDALFDDAARMLVQHQQGSASLLQRKMKIGYNRAGRLIDQMEEARIIGPSEGSKARQVLIADLETLERLLEALPQ
ncbi:MAG: DNA translocase FtsK 4TM domain-containing protein [Vicingaceae bacterium]|nr:DNA translocase FtsK 4TM domain-containing protein [Vicingaceae bacterium]